MAADNGFAAPVSAIAVRGYDAAQEGLAPVAQSAKTTVIDQPGAVERPWAVATPSARSLDRAL
jgi:hypothetical protein